MVIIDTVIHILLGGLTLDPAGMHCPSWDDAFVSSFISHDLISPGRWQQPKTQQPIGVVGLVIHSLWIFSTA